MPLDPSLHPCILGLCEAVSERAASREPIDVSPSSDPPFARVNLSFGSRARRQLVRDLKAFPSVKVEAFPDHLTVYL